MPAIATTLSSSTVPWASAPGAGRLADNDRRARQRGGEQTLELADVALPDHRQPEEDRDEEGRVGHHPGRQVGLVVGGAGSELAVVLERCAEDEQP